MQYRLAGGCPCPELSPFPGSQATFEWGLEVKMCRDGDDEEGRPVVSACQGTEGRGWSLPCFYPLRVSYVEAACC